MLKFVLIGLVLIVLAIIVIIALAIRKANKKPDFVKDVYNQTVKYGSNKTFVTNKDGTKSFVLQSRMNKE